MRRRLVVIICLGLLLPLGIAAQGGDGRSGASRKTTSARRYVRRAPKPVHKSVPIAYVAPVAETARLSIVVDEEGSSVSILRVEAGRESEVARINSTTPSSLIVRALPAGNYRIVAKKPGFVDEVRVVELYPDKRRKVVLNLRPEMALLTVNTNLKDSDIDVGTVGKFVGLLRRQFVKPGMYRISVQRRGYLSQSILVDLKMAGREQNISVVLRPLRIDVVIAQANEKLNTGNHHAASELVNDVLLLNPAHAKANLLMGHILFQRGEPLASESFLTAIKKGETVVLPISLSEDHSVSKLIKVELRLHRDGLSLRSKTRIDLNFTLRRSDVGEFHRQLDQTAITYLTLTGKSDFHGRPIEPKLNIFSPMAEKRGESADMFCASSLTRRTCGTDIDILHKTIADWLEMIESKSK